MGFKRLRSILRKEQKTPQIITTKKSKGKTLLILPSPYKNEKIVIRKKPHHAGTEGNILSAFAVSKEGKEKKVGHITYWKQSNGKFKATDIAVIRNYRRSNIGTTLESLAVLDIEGKGHKNVDMIPVLKQGRAFWAERGYNIKEETHDLSKRKKGKVYVKTGREKLMRPAKQIAEEMKVDRGAWQPFGKFKDYLFNAYIDKKISKGELQYKNYDRVVGLLKSQGMTNEAQRMKEIKKSLENLEIW